jgi:hypothetical protein
MQPHQLRHGAPLQGAVLRVRVAEAPPVGQDINWWEAWSASGVAEQPRVATASHLAVRMEELMLGHIVAPSVPTFAPARDVDGEPALGVAARAVRQHAVALRRHLQQQQAGVISLVHREGRGEGRGGSSSKYTARRHSPDVISAVSM